jgi:pantetheine-phosphate adenylyltransferase, bacterial
VRIAICPGSFDPVTIGHMDIISRTCRTFDKVIVAVSVNPEKKFSFSMEERVSFLKIASAEMGLTVEIDSVSGLLADYAEEKKASIIVKGLRAMTDFEYEFQMALTNKKLNPELETVFFATSAENMFLSSSMVKQVAGFGGDISHFVPECILDRIVDRLSNKKLITEAVTDNNGGIKP